MDAATSANTDRRRAILAAGLKVLVDKGWRGASMIAIAREAHASKETLYNWFGDKAGFFGALIRENAGALDRTLPADFGTLGLEDGLRAFGTELLTLMAGDASVAINRAAIAEAGRDPTLGATLLAEGKHASLPKFAGWLTQHLDLSDPMQAAERFVVLVKGETQLERLLGARGPLSEAEIAAQVDRAVTDFLRLYGTA